MDIRLRIMLGFGILCFVVVILATYYGVTQIKKCEDAGGVNVHGVCINPAAVIEVD